MDVAVGTKLRHEEHVNMGFSEEGGDEWNGRGDEEILGLTKLTFMAAVDEQANILVEMRPPEVKQDVAGSSEDSFVTLACRGCN